MGRTWAEQRTNGTITKNIGYTYNLAGSLATLAYPSGRTLTYKYEAAGRPSTARDLTNGINYVTGMTTGTTCNGEDGNGACYAPNGALATMVNGYTSSFPGITTTNSYNKRLQPAILSASAPSQTVFSLTFNFHLGTGDNGNVWGITNGRDSFRALVGSATYTYDSLNRLQSAATTGTDCTVVNGFTKNWGESYSIDAWGNLLGITPTLCNAENLSVTVGNNNQITNPPGHTYYTYDAAGNMTADGLGHFPVYDGENRIKTVAGVNYTYDGDGKRVKKDSGKLYWTGTGSDPLNESDLSGNMTEEFVFFNGKRIARVDLPSGTVHYYFSDHLGSASVISNATGATIEQEADYYPYGGERILTAGLNNYKFTGKERDTESGLDNFEARYDASSLGRFMTPDPMGGHLENPQSLNKYAYVLNNPTSLTDPTGLDSYLSCTQTKDNASTCQSQTVGYDANGKAQTATVQGVTNADKSFTATQIGNDANGNLVDKTTGTGSYTASANGSGVQFSNNGGQTSSSGVFVNGTPQNTFQDAGFANGGALSGFTFTLTNSKLEAGQTEAGSFTFAGTPDQAGAALQKAGFNPRSGENVGMNEYRSPGSFWTGANSSHFNVFQIGLKPWLSVPQAQGDMHFGEHNPYSPFGWVPHSSEANQ